MVYSTKLLCFETTKQNDYKSFHPPLQLYQIVKNELATFNDYDCYQSRDSVNLCVEN